MSDERQPFSIDEFERAIYKRGVDQESREKAFVAIRQLLFAVKNDAGFSWTGTQPTPEQIFTRLAAALASFFADPAFGVSYEGFCQYAVDHATLHSIFKGSSFRTADFALRLVGTPADNGNFSYSTVEQLSKALLLWSLESDIDWDFDTTAKAMPEFVSAALLGIVGIGGVLNEKAYKRKLELSKKIDLIAGAPLHETMMLAACDNYMHCSYNDDPQRHDIKKALNRMFREVVERKMADHGKRVVERTDKATRKERPKIIVPVEWFSSTHAMYRCYAPSIQQLRKYFEVVAIARPHEMDDEARNAFDRVIMLEPQISMLVMLEAIQREQPDIIFYPSIGMAAWWVAFSQFRLAPVQIMCPGHPATTHNPNIDYMVTDEDLIGDRSRYSEQVVGLPVGTTRYIETAGFDRKQFGKRVNAWPLRRVAVSAMVMKLNPTFLQALKKIAAHPHIEWHFFPNMQASNHYLVEREIHEWIPNAIVHHRNTYANYMDNLAQCDLMLASFPFGGTNSCIDALLCSMPVVCYEGVEIQERSDASMVRRVGLPSWLITHSTEEYIDAAVRLIENKANELTGCQHYLAGKDIEAEFYGDGPEHVRGKFGETFYEIWNREVEKHEQQTAGVSEQTGDDGAGMSAGLTE